MEVHELIGYYSYRSFINEPLPVEDFNKIKISEAELFLIIQINGTINGTLSFPAEPAASEKVFMNITGTIQNWSSPLTLKFTGRGRPNTKISDYLYEFLCSVGHIWEQDKGQRLSLTGTILDAQEHSEGEQPTKTDLTASFIAIKRDFTEPRDVPGMEIIPSALSMIASKSHRLKHAVWHTLRGISNGVAVWYNLDEPSKTKIRELGWGLDRPPFTKEGTLDLSNGAGEDFLFMHRKMIAMIKNEYVSQGVPYIESWKKLRLPQPNAQQFVYSEQDDPANPGKKIYRFNSLESGNMIPPWYPIEGERVKFFKTPDFFRSVMAPLDIIFDNARYLNTLSLGALGNLIEFTIHGWMHMRWSSISGLPRDKNTGELLFRETFDFDNRWDDPKYDYLGEFYSSHVNPLFWRLHGWVDDRIEDWFNAHEASHPGEIERYEYQGVSWFKPGKWVQASKPFYWPEDHHHHHNDNNNDQQEIDNMLKVMKIIEESLPMDTMRADVSKRLPGGLMNFLELTNQI
jgi:hypothetical protein